MKNPRKINLVLVLVLVLLKAGLCFEKDNPKTSIPDAERMLQKVECTVAEYPSIVFNVQSSFSDIDQEGKQIPKRRTIQTYYKDRELVDLKSTRFDFKDGNEFPAIESRGVWDGTFFLHRQKLLEPNSKTIAYFSKDKTLKDILMTQDLSSSFLDGFLDSTQHYYAIMRRTSALKIHNKMESVDDSLCYVLEADTRYGHYKVWIDPKRGYKLRKAIIEKKADNIYGEDSPTLGQMGYKSKTINVNVTKLEKINDIWFPLEGRKESRWVFSEDKIAKEKSITKVVTAVRSNIELNPDFKKLGAFKMDLPNGNLIMDDDNSNKLYEWANGKIQKRGLHLEKKVGQKAPPLIIERWYNGDFWQLNVKDKVVLLDFWGTWCPPCKRQIPILENLSKKYSHRGLVVVGVHTQRSSCDIPDYLLQESISYLIGVDSEDKTAESYEVTSYPTIFLIGKDGLIRYVNPGDKLKEIIAMLLEE